MNKTCNKCGETKLMSEFYHHPKMADGRLGHCKACHRAGVAANRKTKAEYYRLFERIRANDPKRVQARKDYAASARGRSAQSQGRAAWKERNPEKRWAHAALKNARRSGLIVKPDKCEACGKAGRVEGHHDDYTRPLDVRWLCHACQRLVHREPE